MAAPATSRSTVAEVTASAQELAHMAASFQALIAPFKLEEAVQAGTQAPVRKDGQPARAPRWARMALVEGRSI
jgi:hypothetical protein